MDNAPLPPRSLTSWVTIEGTDTSSADPFVVNSIALPDDSSMVGVTICYPVSTIDEHLSKGRAVRIDLYETYFQSFSSGVGSDRAGAEGRDIWSLCVSDASALKSDFIAGIREWAPASWMPAPDEHLRHFAIGRDHYGYSHFLAVDAAVRFFDIDWAPIDEPYDPEATHADRLQRQQVRSQFLVERSNQLGPYEWSS